MDSTLQNFILQHREDDVRQLALTASRYPDIDMPTALVQISGWQTARQKLPLWAATPGILYPPHLNMEQCSSQLAASYKASLVSPGATMTDLTAGFGVDATLLSRQFQHLNYVEQDAQLCTLAQNNLPLLGVPHFTIHQADAAETLRQLPHQDLIYIDPARRDQHGSKVVAISDCTPDITTLQDLLLQKADTVLVKLSPMLDLRTLLRTLKGLAEIHIVSVDGECKELLAKMQSTATEPTLFCVNLKTNGQAPDRLQFTLQSEQTAICHYAEVPAGYLYEPNASIMKAGCFKTLAQTFSLEKLSPNSHLYTSSTPIDHFPGRIFKIETVSSFNKKELKQTLQHIHKANITVRNFPLTVAELRKRLKLAEGGTDYLFATTLNDGRHVLIHTTTCAV